MTQFFLNLLKQLKPLTGHLQGVELTQPGREHELRDLLSALTAECARFKEIPEKAQQQIIIRMVKEDDEFMGLSVKWVYKTLMKNRDKFVVQFGYQETNQLLEGMRQPEPISKATEQLIAQFQENLANGLRRVPTVTIQEIQAHEDRPKSLAAGYVTNPDLIKEHALRTEYLREKWRHDQMPENRNGKDVIHPFLDYETWKKLNA